MKHILIASAFVWTVAGCSDGGGSCTVTYADGLGESFRGTTCPDPEPERVLDATASIEARCTVTDAFLCDDDGTDCRDVHVRDCGEGLVDKALEPGCRKASPSTNYDYSADNANTRQAFAFAGNPWGAGIAAFNLMFQDGRPLPLQWVQAASPAGQGVPFNPRGADIGEFRIFNAGRNANFPTAAGTTTCADSSAFGRHNCVVTIYMQEVRRYAGITGDNVLNVASVTALHELGHAACIQHFDRSVALPSPDDLFTAMNSSFLGDAVNGAAPYFRFTTAEKSNARQAFTNGRNPPATVFERGFNAR